MDFRVLGPFEVYDGGEPVPIGALRQRAVLALLTIHAGEPLSADRIIDEIWAGTPPLSALKTLHAYISRLRGALHTTSVARGHELLVSRRPGYVLAIDDSQIDSVRFERMVDDAARAYGGGSPEQAADTVREAMSLWHGSALADFAYEPFAVTESQRLMERRMEALELRINADLALARHAALIAELEGLVVEHPLRETLWVQLMTALYRSGRQAEALAAYGRVRHALVEELGIEPGPDLRLLERQVLDQSPELAWQPAGGAHSGTTSRGPMTTIDGRSTSTDTNGSPRHSAPEQLPLVGRDRQLEHLADLVHSAPSEGTPRVVLVLGEPGCGKSRLLAEVRRRTRERGVLTASGSAERESSAPYGPFADIVRDVLHETGMATLERVGHLRGDLAWLLPELGPQPETDDLGSARRRMFEAVVQLLARAGSSEPLLLLVDDAHGLGDGSAALVHAMLDRSWTRPVVVVLAVRTESGERRINIEGPILDLLRREGSATLEVGRLSAQDLADLVSAMAGDKPGPESERVAGRLLAQTAGIPLLVREVLTAGVEHLDDAVPDAGNRLGNSPLVEAIVSRRLKEVGRPVQRLLETAAVIGTRFDVGVLAEVTNSAAAIIADQLDEAIEAGIVVETGQLDVLTFDHGLMRDVAVGWLSASRQVRLHGEIAAVLSTRGSAVEAARHGLLAYVGITARSAVEMTITGADSAMAALEFEVARTLCSDALAGPAADLEPGLRADLLMRLGHAQSLTGEAEEAERSWASAAELARGSGDDERLATIALATGTLAHAHTATSELHWNLLTEALDRTGPGWTRLRVLVACEWLLEAILPHRRAAGTRELADEVVEAAVALGDQHALAAAFHVRHVLSRWQPTSQRARWSDELITVAEDLGAGEWLFEGRLARLIDRAEGADGEGMDQALDQLRLTCAEYRVPRALWLFELAASTCARLRGEFDIADEHTAAAAEIGMRYAMRDGSAALGAAEVLNKYHRGGLGTLRQLLTDFATLVPHVPAWTFAAGLAAADDDDVDAGQALLARGMDAIPDRPEEIWLAGLCLASELVGQVGADGAIIDRLLELLGPYPGRFAVIGVLSSEFGPTDRAIGILNSARGDGTAADRHFDAAIAACERLGARPWELRTRVDWMIADRWLGRSRRSWWESLPSELDAAGLSGAKRRLERGLSGITYKP